MWWEVFLFLYFNTQKVRVCIFNQKENTPLPCWTEWVTGEPPFELSAVGSGLPPVGWVLLASRVKPECKRLPSPVWLALNLHCLAVGISLTWYEPILKFTFPRCLISPTQELKFALPRESTFNNILWKKTKELPGFSTTRTEELSRLFSASCSFIRMTLSSPSVDPMTAELPTLLRGQMLERKLKKKMLPLMFWPWSEADKNQLTPTTFSSSVRTKTENMQDENAPKKQKRQEVTDNQRK